MVELIFALLVLQVGVLATAGMVLLAQQNLRRAELIERGVVEAEWIGDSLANAGGGGPGSVPYPWGEVVWTTDGAVTGGWTISAVDGVSGDTLVSLPVLPALPRRSLTGGCGLGGPVRVEAP